jgi:hypothetical protein
LESFFSVLGGFAGDVACEMGVYYCLTVGGIIVY